MKKSHIYAGILAAALSTSLSGCGKNVDCDVPGNHIHIYQNENGMSRLIMGEKEEKSGYTWTSDYVEANSINKKVAEAGLLSIKDNIDYVLSNVNKLPEPYREEYVYDYVYGTYQGWGYCYHWDGDDWTYGYGYGTVTGYHWDYVWEKVAMDTYTSNKVKDTVGMFKLYRLSPEGEFEAKYFSSFDEVESGYIYFKSGEFIVQVESDSYYLNPMDFQNNNSLTK